jgi:hypothetical protein
LWSWVSLNRDAGPLNRLANEFLQVGARRPAAVERTGELRCVLTLGACGKLGKVHLGADWHLVSKQRTWTGGDAGSRATTVEVVIGQIPIPHTGLPPSSSTTRFLVREPGRTLGRLTPSFLFPSRNNLRLPALADPTWYPRQMLSQIRKPAGRAGRGSRFLSGKRLIAIPTPCSGLATKPNHRASV